MLCDTPNCKGCQKLSVCMTKPEFHLEKPPLGVEPRYAFETRMRFERMKELVKAMDRYIEKDILVPEEWAQELYELCKKESK